MNGTPLILGPAELAELAALRDLAARHPVDMKVLMEALKHRAGKAAHKHQMTSQSVPLPTDYLVTFSIETGHPVGACRHMSMSVGKKGRLPNPHAMWMVAEQLGFIGGLEACMHWLETLEGHGEAVNLVQPLSTVPAHHDAPAAGAGLND